VKTFLSKKKKYSLFSIILSIRLVLHFDDKVTKCITRNSLLWLGKRRQLVAISTYFRPRVFSTRITRTYASWPRLVTGDIICSWSNRFHCLAVGVWPAPGINALLLARYTRIRVYYASPFVITPVPPPPLSLSLSLSLSLLLLPCPLIPSLSFYVRHLVYSILYRPTGPACGRASTRHLHSVKRRKLVKARAVVCRIASRTAVAVSNVCGSLQRVSGKTKHQRTARTGEISATPLFRTNRQTWKHLTGINVFISLSRPAHGKRYANW